MLAQPNDMLIRLVRPAVHAVLLVLVLLASAVAASAQDEYPVQHTPPPKPETIPLLVDVTGLFTDDQLAVLQHDALRLMRINIPTLVYIRIADNDRADPASNQAFADALRQTWDIGSSPESDDGLVMLITLNRQNAAGHLLALSYGEQTFTRSGLTPGYIANVFSREIEPLLSEGRYYEGMYTLIRRVRYGGIYFPPPIAPIEGVERALHTTMSWLASMSVIAVAATLVILSLRQPAERPVHRTVTRKAGIAIGLLAVALAVLGVAGRSGIAVGSAMAIALTLGIQLWMWTHPRRGSRLPSRTRLVPPTARHLRTLRRGRRISLGATTGVGR